MAQSKGINFEGQNIYVGIDVHLKTWHVTVLTQSGYKRKHSQKSSGKELFEHLHRHYPGGRYYAIYEAGFSGFSTYYDLESHGISCVVAHAADIPTGQFESVMKTDAVDSEKLARTLRDGSLRSPVHVPGRDILDHRGILRFRKQVSRWIVCAPTCCSSTVGYGSLPARRPTPRGWNCCVLSPVSASPSA